MKRRILLQFLRILFESDKHERFGFVVVLVHWNIHALYYYWKEYRVQ
ncbi:hypothetical protein Hanom_Chr14g01252001 [Helianthus anomalus]